MIGNPIYGKIKKWQPNHQPVMDIPFSTSTDKLPDSYGSPVLPCQWSRMGKKRPVFCNPGFDHGTDSAMYICMYTCLGAWVLRFIYWCVCVNNIDMYMCICVYIYIYVLSVCTWRYGSRKKHLQNTTIIRSVYNPLTYRYTSCVHRRHVKMFIAAITAFLRGGAIEITWQP